MRWAEVVKDFKQQQSTLCGDVLLITAFVSYLGYFTKKYRQELLDGIWKPYLHQLKVSPAFSEKQSLLCMIWPQALLSIGGLLNEVPPSCTVKQVTAMLNSLLSGKDIVVSLTHASDPILPWTEEKSLCSISNVEPGCQFVQESGIAKKERYSMEKGLLGAGRAHCQLFGRLGKTPDGTLCRT